MPDSKIRPVRFRARLMIAFVAAVAVGAGAVALGAYALVRADRYDSFHERSLTAAGLSMSLADAVLDEHATPDELVSFLDERRVLEAVAVHDGDAAATRSGLVSLFENEPIDLGAPEDGFRFGELRSDRGHYLVLRPVDPAGDADLYLLFTLSRLDGELARMSGALLRSWSIAVALSAALGYVVARRILRPVSRASAAARDLAEGILATRLPIERTDEFGAWAISFNRMADALQEKIEALTAAHARERRFTSDVAHELRTPLTALMTSATFLRSQQHLMDADARWAAESVLSQVARLRDLTEELLEISRLDAGQESISEYEIDLEALCRDLLRSRRWTDRVSLSLGDRKITSDPRRLERILANLIDNALAHGNGPVDVAAHRRGSQIVLTVRDTGPGMDPEVAPHVFERFFKADPSRSGGSGLGLAIARENARLLGGDVTIARSDRTGTEMVVVLPLGSDEGAALPEDVEESIVAPPPIPHSGHAPLLKGGSG